MDSFWAAIAGGAITGAVALGTQLINARSERRRDRLRLIIEASIHEHKVACEIAEAQGHAGGVPPLSIFIHYQAGVIDLLESNNLTAESLEVLNKTQGPVNDMIKKAWARARQ